MKKMTEAFTIVTPVNRRCQYIIFNDAYNEIMSGKMILVAPATAAAVQPSTVIATTD
jgi:hypothetical protein